MTIPKPEDMIHANIAIVLTDIIGSTKFVQAVGKEMAATRFAQHDRMVMGCISSNNGRLVDASDGHLMYFPTVQDAIAFAFKYKRRLKEIGFPFKSRVGIHWDSMLIVKTAEHVVRAGGKRINLEGLGKNIAARTMSLCGPHQILLSKAAYQQFRSRTKSHPYIPKNALIAMVGLYKFKGVTNPEQIYAIGTEQAHLQPPPSNEKVKRLGGKNKIKTRLKHKKFKEIIQYIIYRLSIFCLFYLLFIFWPLLSSKDQKAYWNLDYKILIIFEYINVFLISIYNLILTILKGFL
jgi:class 3 adenylate cyclase